MSGDAPGPGRVIDVHAHVWLNQLEPCRRELIESVDAVPLERLYVSGIEEATPDEETVVALNDAVHGLMKDCPRVRGQVYLNPRHGEWALDELSRCADLGFTCVKLWVATLADDPRRFPIYEAAIERGLPVLVHAWDKAVGQGADESKPWHVAAAARRYPECAFVMAHVGGDFISGAESVAAAGNVRVDISGTYGEVGGVEYAVRRLGPERVLFGSDMPSSDVYHNLGKVAGAAVPPAVKAMILHGNAERLLR